MILETVASAACASAGLLAYAVRGRSSSLLSPSVHRGPRTRTAIALTFDDGPSESTPELMDMYTAAFGTPEFTTATALAHLTAEGVYHPPTA